MLRALVSTRSSNGTIPDPEIVPLGCGELGFDIGLCEPDLSHIDSNAAAAKDLDFSNVLTLTSSSLLYLGITSLARIHRLFLVGRRWNGTCGSRF